MAKGIAGLGRRRGRDPFAAVPPDRRIVLHVGCGVPHPLRLHETFRTPDWHELRLDIDPGVEPDIVGSMVEMPNVPSESVHAVWSSHNLEHVYAHQVRTVLGEFLRVLRPNGFALIMVPDLQEVARVVATGNLDGPFYRSEAGHVAAIEVMYGHSDSIAEGNEFMAHRTGFTARTLSERLRRAGFVDVRVTKERIALLWANARKPDRRASS
jgi:SAM-dependent methyltransferase